MVKTACFQCIGCDPLVGNLKSHMPRDAAKKIISPEIKVLDNYFN